MSAADNHLIALLPRQDRTLILDVCEVVDLQPSEIISTHGEPTLHAYFPTAGFISLLASVDGHPGLEVGMIGNEGMLGSQLALGVAIAPLDALVQGAGHAFRITAVDFHTVLGRSKRLQRILNRYLYVLMVQLMASATCLRFHLIGPRLARWLLMSHDCAQADTFHVTHELLAHMLGVRRVGITMAAGVLQRSGLIAYRRGELTVINRKGLEDAACTCYAANCSTYVRMMS